MYASESPGGLWPPAQHQPPGFEGALLIPYVPGTYPEYVTEPAIYVCPSNSSHSIEDMYCHTDNEFNGLPVLIDRRRDDPGNPEEFNQWWHACWSYMYWGFMYDLCDDTPQNLTEVGIYFSLLEIAEQLLETELDIDSHELVPAQFIHQWVKLFMENGFFLHTGYIFGPMPALDRDTVAEPDDFLAGHGNGHGDIVYRLREGGERLTVENIVDPAASAMAQSRLFVMHDWVSTEAVNFNHTPGGSNVLFMDGHVEFIKYPNTRAPVIKAIAKFTPLFSGDRGTTYH